MSTPQYYDNGTWNALCDVCGRQFRSFQLMKRWDGLMVCKGDWEPRQPQDFVRGVADIQAPPWTKPEPSDTFIFVCNLWTGAPMADYGVADCMTVDGTTNMALLMSMFTTTSVAGEAISGTSLTGTT